MITDSLDYLLRHGWLRMEVVARAEPSPEFKKGYTAHKVRLYHQGRQMTVKYHLPASVHRDPRPEEVVQSLLRDESILLDRPGLEAWSKFHGLSLERWNGARARRVYAALQAQSKKLRRLLGKRLEWMIREYRRNLTEDLMARRGKGSAS